MSFDFFLDFFNLFVSFLFHHLLCYQQHVFHSFGKLSLKLSYLLICNSICFFAHFLFKLFFKFFNFFLSIRNQFVFCCTNFSYNKVLKVFKFSYVCILESHKLFKLCLKLLYISFQCFRSNTGCSKHLFDRVLNSFYFSLDIVDCIFYFCFCIFDGLLECHKLFKLCVLALKVCNEIFKCLDVEIKFQ